jgi:hypothetical protein
MAIRINESIINVTIDVITIIYAKAFIFLSHVV